MDKANDNLTYVEDESYFEDEDLGMTQAEFEKKLAKGIDLLKELARLKGNPTSEWDEELKKPYLLYPDGRREY